MPHRLIYLQVGSISQRSQGGKDQRGQQQQKSSPHPPSLFWSAASVKQTISEHSFYPLHCFWEVPNSLHPWCSCLFSYVKYKQINTEIPGSSWEIFGADKKLSFLWGKQVNKAKSIKPLNAVLPSGRNFISKYQKHKVELKSWFTRRCIIQVLFGFL